MTALEQSCCAKAQKCCSSSFLLICNIVDLVAGCVILIYAVWLWSHKLAPLWLWGCCAGLAALLMFTALVSWGGVNSRQCPGLLTCSQFLALPILLWEAGLGAITLTKTALLEKYLRAHHEQLDMSAYDMKLVAARHVLLAYALFALAGMECMRLLSSRGLKSALRAEREHYDGLRSGGVGGGVQLAGGPRGGVPQGWAGVLDGPDAGADAYAEDAQDELSALHGPAASRISGSSYQSSTGW
eukprot:g3403.t1